jgi:hypothetical protein
MSRKLASTIRMSEVAAYRIALRAGLRPETLSRLMNGAVPIRAGDPRVLAVARVVGVLAREAFDPAAPAESARRWRQRLARRAAAEGADSPS